MGISSIQSNVRTSAQYKRGHRMPPARPLLNMGRCELTPKTAVRTRAQARYSERFRAAYAHHRSSAGFPHRTFSTKSPAPPIKPPFGTPPLLTTTSLLQITTLRPNRTATRGTSSTLGTRLLPSITTTNPPIPGASSNPCPASSPTPIDCDNDARPCAPHSPEPWLDIPP